MHAAIYFLSTATRVLFPLMVIFALGCRTAGQVRERPPDVKASDTKIMSFQAITMPVDSLDSAYRRVAVKLVQDFYQDRQNRLFWISGANGSVAADSLIAFIGNVRYFGLFSGDYQLSEIQHLKTRLNSAKNVCRLEALLTDAYLAINRNIRSGRIMPPTRQADSLSMLSLSGYARGGALHKWLAAGEPSSLGYRSLRRGLEQLIDSLPEDLRTDVLSHSPMVPDDFQNKMRMIEINLERWRSESVVFGSRYIFVNIPSFMLYVVENDSVILASRVIIGAPETPTPVLSSNIECFVTYPYWHVPRKIAVQEYLPVIQENITFIERNNFDVLDRKGKILNPDSVDWKSFSRNYFPVSLRQREGSDNALGIIKFLFDNPYAVYLHDTNAKRLFASRTRALSHGCIRMEKAIELAHYFVTGRMDKKSRDLERFLKEKKRHWIDLQTPMPLFVRYYTCDFYDEQLHFYKDIYSKDKRIGDRLYMNVDFD